MKDSIVIRTLIGALLLTAWSAGASAAPPKIKNQDIKAKQVLARGVELLESSQDERAVKLLSSIPRLFPKSPVRFKAFLALGKHYMDKSQYERAIAQFNTIKGCEDVDISADALYQMGICYFNMNKYDNAFASLRKVTNEYAGSVYANESFYYIGQCHFKLGRWAKAVEALQRVGTSISSKAEDKQDITAEAGQELFFKVVDKDLVVLNRDGKISAKVVANSGDVETITLTMLGKDPSQYIGKIPTKLGKPSAGDNVLQIIGGDSVTATYVDENTAAGQRHQKVLAAVRMVSTAATGFTNGAYSEYVEGVIGNTESFLRVKDMDRDVTHNKDTVQITISTRYKVRQEAADAVASDSAEYANEQRREIWKTRDTITVTLNETEEHTGVFTGKAVPKIVTDPTGIDPGDKTLSAMKGDEMVCVYVDNRHMGGEDPVEVKGTTKVFIGKPNDVAIRHWLVDDPEQKARKNLIEAKIYLKLAGIFKDVGLSSKASIKAEQGIKRVDLVIRSGLKASMDRSIIEEAFMVKWELRLVQDKLPQAIGVCRTLMRLFPDSTLVDRALLKIGQAKLQGGDLGGAVSIFASIVRLPQSTLKAEAQYMIAQAHESRARASAARAKALGRKANLAAGMGRAISSYQTCAEKFPESAFAGPSLEKIANFYLLTKDFKRAGELMERVVQDYPDASFLDRMLLNWAKAAQGMGDSATAKAKCEQLMSEYPGSSLAPEAMAIIKAGGVKPADTSTDGGAAESSE
ncbi:MAG: tetratricopeptide repeat protein [Phycisphaerae bacterium]|nr:tetratricopeptide repeat protein [Phycisphaerae bacterium]